MRWPSKNPDDYLDRSVGVPPASPRTTLPARFLVAYASAFWAFFMLAAFTDDDATRFLVRAGFVGVLILSLWWEERARLVILVAATGLGCAIGAVIGALVAGDAWDAAALGAILTFFAVALVVRLRNRRHPVEPRPQPAPLQAPAWLERIVPWPSKNPDDYV